MRQLLILPLLAIIGCSTSQDQLEEFFLDGNEQLSAGEYELAIEAFSQAIKLKSDFPEAFNNRGVAQMESNHPYEAILDYNQAIRLEPEYVDARLNRAYALEAIGQYKNALEDVDFLRLQTPDSAYYSYYRGVLTFQLRDYQMAEKNFNEALSQGFEEVQPLVNLATIHYFQRDLTKARSVIDKALILAPTRAEVWATLSEIHLAEDSLDQALYAVERALQMDAENPYYLNNRGLIHLERGDLREAVEDINASILKDPDNGWAYRNKGRYYHEKGAYARAIELYNRAEETQEFIEPLLVLKAETYLAMGQPDVACEQVVRAKEVGEAVPDIWESRCR